MTRTRLASTLALLLVSGCASAPPAEAPAQPSAPPGEETAADVKEGYRDGAPAKAAASSSPSPEPMAAPSPRPSPPTVSPGSSPPAVRADAPSPKLAHKMPSAEVRVRGSVSGAAGAASAVRAAEPAPAPVAVSPSPSVKAGEWDDNANYREFQRWLGTESGQPFHRADIRDRQFLVVRDAEGKAVPRCPVIVADAQGHQITLTTTASGRAVLFPHAEGFRTVDLTASTTCQNGSARQAFSITQSDGVVDLKLAVKRALPATRDVDIAFILDTTGSMGEEIAAVKGTLQKVAASLSSAQVRVRIGLVEYKDRTDAFVTKVYPMTTDVAAFTRSVAGIEARGGGDTPESVNEGLHVGLTGLAWSSTAVARMAFLIGDAPPHLDYPNDFDYAADMKSAAHQGIQVFTVAASGMDDLGQVVFRQIAQYTGAQNLFVMRGGAGPQSTGAGDPRSSCGGTQTQYQSGNLDALIVQKITRELRLIDRNPLLIPGLRVDESAKPCAERLQIAG
jgi:hypothetical protein